MKSVVFLTTPTSATASAWRVLTRVSRGLLTPNRFTDSFYASGELELMKQEQLPKDDQLILFNVPVYFNFEQDLDDFKYIINVRDPRDLLCNMYYWSLVHPEPGLNESELKQRKDEIVSKGIDYFVLEKNVHLHYENIMRLTKSVDSRNISYATYSMLCCHFDEYLRSVSKFMDVGLTEDVLLDLACERVENLQANKAWIGNQWAGSDVLPGRYTKELKNSTINLLNDKYKLEIEFCALADLKLG